MLQETTEYRNLLEQADKIATLLMQRGVKINNINSLAETVEQVLRSSESEALDYRNQCDIITGQARRSGILKDILCKLGWTWEECTGKTYWQGAAMPLEDAIKIMKNTLCKDRSK